MRRYSLCGFGVLTLLSCGGGTHATPTAVSNRVVGNSTTPPRASRLAPSVFDKPAFTASPKELLALAAAAPVTGDHVAIVLYEEYALRYDDNHRLYSSWRYVSR